MIGNDPRPTDYRRDLRRLLRRSRRWIDRLAPLGLGTVRPARAEGWVASFPKSGRTWLAHLYTNYAWAKYAPVAPPLPFSYKPEQLPEFLALFAGRVPPNFPRLTFTHVMGNQKRQVPYYALEMDVETVLRRPTVLLVRDPRDVVVSYYHHTRFKSGLPLPDDLELQEFIRSELCGIRVLIAFLNAWGPALERADPRLVYLRYSDMHADTGRALTGLLEAWGVPPDPVAIGRAVAESSFERMREKEIARLQAKGQGVLPDRLRMRQGRQGGHRVALSDEDQAYLERMLRAHLHPAFHADFLADPAAS